MTINYPSSQWEQTFSFKITYNAWSNFATVFSITKYLHEILCPTLDSIILEKHGHGLTAKNLEVQKSVLRTNTSP